MFATQVRDAAAAAAALDVATLTDTALMDHVLQLEHAQRQLDAARANALAHLDTTLATITHHGLRTPTWVTHHAPQHRANITRHIATAQQLARDYPAATTAFNNGQLSFDHCHTLTRVTNPRNRDALAEILPELIELAQHLTFPVWTRELTAIATTLDPDGPEPADTTRNRLRLRPTLDGANVDANYHGADAAELRALLDAHAEALHRCYRRLAEQTDDTTVIPNHSQLLAEALLDLVRLGTATDTATTTPTRPDVTLILEPDGTVVTPNYPTGSPLTSYHLRSLLRRALFHIVTITPNGHAHGPSTPLDTIDPNSPAGRLVATVLNESATDDDTDRGPRFANRALRRAVAARDGGCVFPGCDAPINWCDNHHVISWSDGGRTTIDNTAALCRFHHAITHLPGWTMHATDTQWFWWTTPKGITLHSQRHHTPPPGAPPGAPPDT